MTSTASSIDAHSTVGARQSGIEWTVLAPDKSGELYVADSRISLDGLYRLSKVDPAEAAVRTILRFESDMREGNFASVDAFLARVEVGQLPVRVLVSALSITWHAKDKLACRPGFVERTRERLTNELGPEKAGWLLRHRE